MRRTPAALAAALILAAGCGSGPEPEPAEPPPTEAPPTEAAPPTTTDAEEDDCRFHSGYWTARGFSPEEAEEAKEIARSHFRSFGYDPCPYPLEKLKADLATLEADEAEAARPAPEPPPSTAPAAEDTGPAEEAAATVEEAAGPAEVFAEEGELGVEFVTIPPGEPVDAPPPSEPEAEARDCVVGEDDNECERLSELVQGCLAEGKTEAECGIVGAGDNPAPTGTIIDYGSNEHEGGWNHPPQLKALPTKAGEPLDWDTLIDAGSTDIIGRPWTVPITVGVGTVFHNTYTTWVVTHILEAASVSALFEDGDGEWLVYLCYKADDTRYYAEATSEDGERYRVVDVDHVIDGGCPAAPADYWASG